jgi:hypothetical protein
MKGGGESVHGFWLQISDITYIISTRRRKDA